LTSGCCRAWWGLKVHAVLRAGAGAAVDVIAATRNVMADCLDAALLAGVGDARIDVNCGGW
jgi:type II secretory pathway component PulL